LIQRTIVKLWLVQSGVMRFPKVLVVATTLIAVALLALALVRPASQLPEVRLNRLLRVEGARLGTLQDKHAPDFSAMASAAAETWMAEFLIQVPSESGIWLADGQIGVEVLGVRGDWTRLRPKEESPAPPSSGLSCGRTISWTIWRVLPAGVQRCRFTIGFRGETLQERGIGCRAPLPSDFRLDYETLAHHRAMGGMSPRGASDRIFDQT